jgi:hypothetical protein
MPQTNASMSKEHVLRVTSGFLPSVCLLAHWPVAVTVSPSGHFVNGVLSEKAVTTLSEGLQISRFANLSALLTKRFPAAAPSSLVRYGVGDRTVHRHGDLGAKMAVGGCRALSR